MKNYIVSARKYRPTTFSSVIGQQALTVTLKNAIASQKLAHAYLFCGPRGVGKTTCARIFAKTINCLNPTADGEACNECESCKAINEQRSYSLHELDAASNNSVEDIRQLIEQVRIPPQVGKYKVYIIDEVHMLSASAFNSFLKTLEEPPSYAIFILATTEKHKILPTILSRCQIHDFNRIGVNDIVEHLQSVAQEEHIEAEPEALNVIAQKADGGMRDALSIFDQVTSYTNGHITYKSTIENLNVLDYEYYFRITDCLLENKVSEVLLLFNEILSKGFDGNHFITGLGSHFRNLLVSRDAATLPLLEAGASVRERYSAQARKCKPKFLYKAMKMCNECDLNYRVSKNRRFLVELTLIEVAQFTTDDDGISCGLGPTKKLKPLFKQQDKKADVKVAQTQAPAAAVQKNEPTALHAHPVFEPNEEKKIPKAESIGFSIKGLREAEKKGNMTQTTPSIAAAPANPSVTEENPFDLSDLVQYWYEFANLLPNEEAATTGRMKNMKPALIDGITFAVEVENEMVRNYLSSFIPKIEQFMQSKLHNKNIHMQIKLMAQTTKRAYTRVEKFQMMAKKNPGLQKLKEKLGLEFY